jgi:hypothetical protein
MKMYLQTVKSKKLYKPYVSADPDLDQNVTDPQHYVNRTVKDPHNRDADPDRDPPYNFDADPCGYGSGSATLLYRSLESGFIKKFNPDPVSNDTFIRIA